jgi:hypothetical protein
MRRIYTIGIMAAGLIFAVLHLPPARLLHSARVVGFYFHDLKRADVSRNPLEGLVYSLVLAKTGPPQQQPTPTSF